MKNVTIGIVEDEIIIAEGLKSLLLAMNYTVLPACSTYTETIELLEGKSVFPDLFILDIKLQGPKSGVDIAHVLNIKYRIPFIFLSSYSDKKTLDDVKTTLPHGFLVKPFNKATIHTTIEIVLSNFFYTNQLSSVSPFLFVKKKEVYYKIDLKDIIYIKSDHVYLEIYTVDKEKFIIRNTMSNVLSKLTNDFIQIHQSYIVNIRFSKFIAGNYILIQDEKLPIGRTFKQLIYQRIATI